MDTRFYPQGSGGDKVKLESGIEVHRGRTSTTNRTPRYGYGWDPINRVFQSGPASDNAGNTLRFNSITNSGTTEDFIGVQIKPGQGATSTKGLKGLEVSPRVNSGVELANITGAHITAYLRGTAAGTISGDVRGLNLELVTDDAGTRTISGNVSMLRFRAAFSATTINGKFVPIRIEKAETQTNSKQFDAVLELPSTNGTIWDDTANAETAAGLITVLVNGNVRYIQLYSALA